jgi:hypothetical protein
VSIFPDANLNGQLKQPAAKLQKHTKRKLFAPTVRSQGKLRVIKQNGDSSTVSVR